jgi:predicted ABC-type ATPase
MLTILSSLLRGPGGKRLRMFAGPNGSGKTTLISRFAREFSAQGLFSLHHFINADDLSRALKGDGIAFDAFGLDVTWHQLRESLIGAGRLRADHPFLEAGQVHKSRLTAPADMCDDYVAASIADFLRDELLACGQSFSFETVMSHRSKIDFFARARIDGYRTYLYFIATDSPQVNLGRVKERVAAGGHDVPEAKILERYERCLQLVRDALAHAYRAFLFDNSGAEPIWLAEFDPRGECQLKVSRDSLPNWFHTWIWSPEPPTAT